MPRSPGARGVREAPAVQRVNWEEILADLSLCGVRDLEAADWLDVAPSTLKGWRRGIEPRHCKGEALLELWMTATGKGRSGIPLARFPAGR